MPPCAPFGRVHGAHGGSLAVPQSCGRAAFAHPTGYAIVDAHIRLPPRRLRRQSEFGRKPMRVLTVASVAVALLAGAANAQQTPPPPPTPFDNVPDKMPAAEPYGAPISAQRAQAAIQAAMAEATKRGWPLNIAVFDSGANLVAFVRMDGALLGSITVSQHKARAAVKFRRPTKVFE